jgi:hypothetical protein
VEFLEFSFISGLSLPAAFVGAAFEADSLYQKYNKISVVMMVM